MGAFLLNIVLSQNAYYTCRFPEAGHVSELNLVNARTRKATHIERISIQSRLVTISIRICLTPICPGGIRVALLEWEYV